jgi:hypothetical protein
MNFKNFDQIGEMLSIPDMKQIKGGVAPAGCNVFTTDTMTPNASMTYSTWQGAASACFADPGCVGVDVTSTCP